jgi:thiamine-monophosphate kinase
MPGDRLQARVVELGSGGEFDAIRRFLRGAGPPPTEALVGPGDDAAVLEGGWVVSTDLSVEDVHFRHGWGSNTEIGYRAAAAALSDLAAMAARPFGILVSLAIPEGDSFDAGLVHEGVREAAATVGAGILGGDVSRSPGPLVLDIVVMGQTDRPLLRIGAEPGDELWTTGTLGGSAAAVQVWEAGRKPPDDLRRAFLRPMPRVSAAQVLAEHNVAVALIDLSDGLAGDAGHLAAAGEVGVVLEASAVPVNPVVEKILGAATALELALHGGEDYELCFAARPGSVDPGRLTAALDGLALSRVGRVVEGEGVTLENLAGDVVPLTRGGFSHLSGGVE